MSRRKKTESHADDPTRDKVAEQLRGIARDLDHAADRADTLDAEDTRRREAAQVRFVATCVITRITPLLVGNAWLSAGKRRVAAYEVADMDAVHASRSSRREAKADDDA